MLLTVIFVSRLALGYQCFASLPSSFTLDDTYEYQASGYCNDKCTAKGYKYFALTQGNQCYCGNDNPADSQSTSTGCTSTCFGYPAEMCGGANAFSVYAITANGGTAVEVTGSSSLSSSSSSSTSSTSSTSSSSSTTSSSTTTSSSSTTTSSSSSSSSSTSSRGTTTTRSSESADSVVYLTATNTDGGSTVFVTSTITTSTQGMPTSTSSNDSNTNHKKKVNIGAIVGGVVGGVGGALVIGAAVLLILRHVNKRREQERMEKEYQEAIKPVEYGDKLHHGGSSVSLNNLQSSGSFDDTTHAMSSNNPFDDSRRISNGSILNAPSHTNPKTLTVVNPDED